MKHPLDRAALLTPAEVIAPGCGDPRLLTRSPVRSVAGAADLAPAPPRPRSEDALACPTRMGNRLHHRDGRITDLNGTLLTDGSGHPIHTAQEPTT